MKKETKKKGVSNATVGKLTRIKKSLPCAYGSVDKRGLHALFEGGYLDCVDGKINLSKAGAAALANQ